MNPIRNPLFISDATLTPHIIKPIIWRYVLLIFPPRMSRSPMWSPRFVIFGETILWVPHLSFVAPPLLSSLTLIFGKGWRLCNSLCNSLLCSLIRNINRRVHVRIILLCVKYTWMLKEGRVRVAVTIPTTCISTSRVQFSIKCGSSPLKTVGVVFQNSVYRTRLILYSLTQ
jgi:hypothetical protein